MSFRKFLRNIYLNEISVANQIDSNFVAIDKYPHIPALLTLYKEVMQWIKAQNNPTGPFKDIYVWLSEFNAAHPLILSIAAGTRLNRSFIQERYKACVKNALVNDNIEERRVAAIEARWWGAILREDELRKEFPNEPTEKTKSEPGLTEAISLLYRLVDSKHANRYFNIAEVYWMLRPELGYILPSIPHIGLVTAAGNDLDVAVNHTGYDHAFEQAIQEEYMSPRPKFKANRIRELLEILLLPDFENPRSTKYPYTENLSGLRILRDFCLGPFSMLINPNVGISAYQRMETVNSPRVRSFHCVWWFLPLFLGIAITCLVELPGRRISSNLLLCSSLAPLFMLAFAVFTIWASCRLPIFGIGGRLAWKLVHSLEQYASRKIYAPVNIAVIGSTRAGKSTWVVNLARNWKEVGRPWGFLKDKIYRDVSQNPSTKKPVVYQYLGNREQANGNIPTDRNEILSILDTRGQSLNEDPNVIRLGKVVKWVHAIIIVRPCIWNSESGYPPPDHIQSATVEFHKHKFSKTMVYLFTRADAEGCNVPIDVVLELRRNDWMDAPEFNQNYPTTRRFIFDGWERMEEFYDSWCADKSQYIHGKIGDLPAPPQTEGLISRISHPNTPYDFVVDIEKKNHSTFFMTREANRLRARQNYVIDLLIVLSGLSASFSIGLLVNKTAFLICLIAFFVPIALLYILFAILDSLSAGASESTIGAIAEKESI